MTVDSHHLLLYLKLNCAQTPGIDMIGVTFGPSYFYKDCIVASQSPPKPFKSYSELTDLLIERGMEVEDRARAERKLAQVGYYRLSGFWYPCREINFDTSGDAVLSSITGRPERLDNFLSGTSFNAVFELYLFDKKLRQLILDAIERIEIHIRSLIAHEMGKLNPLAYQDPQYINPKQKKTYYQAGRERNIWNEWLARQEAKVQRSREDCIHWYRVNGNPLPFWVCVEAWDFGTMSKYYEILNKRCQNRICNRLGISKANILKVWLQEMNTLRNRCAHHTRIWNQKVNNPIPVLSNEYFDWLALDVNARSRLYGMVCVLWYLVEKIGSSSTWISLMSDLIDSKPELPGCSFESMGVPVSGFPRDNFYLFKSHKASVMQ